MIKPMRSCFPCWRSLEKLLAQVLLISGIAACARPAPATPDALRTVPAVTAILPAADTPVPTNDPQPSPAPAEVATPEVAGVAEASTPTIVSHEVQVGDTLLGLARKYGVSMAAIQLENQIGSSTVVRVGDTLSIPSGDQWPASSAFWVLHEVTAGETLIVIARAYEVEPARLQAVNGLEDADYLTPGQQLVLPLTGPAASRGGRVTEAPAPTQTAAPQQAAAASDLPESTVVVHTPLPLATPPAELATWAREIVRLINGVRAQHGVAPLAYHPALEQAAQIQADDCARRGWCSHTGSDGSDIRTRIRRVGYDPSTWAECWAQAPAPRRAVDMWMDETPPHDPHRRTLLSPRFSEIGIGVADAPWGAYVIANFGQP